MIRFCLFRPSPFRSVLILSLAMAATAALCTAEDNDLSVKYHDKANQLIDAALADTDGYARLAYLCDRIGNRLSGSPALTKAIEWSAAEMTKAGLEHVVTPPVKVPVWVRGQESAEIVEPMTKRLHMLGLGLSVGTPPGGITADVVVVPDFDALTKLGKGAAGKIVVFNAPYVNYGVTVAYRALGASRAAELGAVAVLVRSITPLAMQTPHTGALSYLPNQPKIPAAAISIEDAMLLDRMQQRGEKPRVHLEMQAHMEPDADSANVIGEIPGSEKPEEVVVLGGHLDSWDVGQGAQDDGSGVMASLEAVALIKKLGLKPRRTIRVVFWVNEENGGRGGEAYRAWVGDQIKNHVAAIEMDSGAEKPVGFGFGPYQRRRRAQGNEPAPPAPKMTAEQEESLAECQQIAHLLERIEAGKATPGGGGADIGPLVHDGVPGLSPETVGLHYFDWHHTDADTVDKVNPDDFRRNIAVLAVLSYILADMPGKLAGAKGAAGE
jgi:Peptidase family M28